MGQRALWFLIGAVTASAFWLIVLNGMGRQWLDVLMKAG
jgi:arginine exporter protein ArgO